MEMRLGKSLVAIRRYETVAGLKLIVAPLSVLHTWQDELHQESHPALVLRDNISEDDVEKFAGTWCLCNFQALFHGDRSGSLQRTGRRAPVKPSWIAMYPWRVVVIDESVTIKNPTSSITKCVQRYLGNVPYRACLSGLPNPQSSLDVFEQMRFVFGSFMGCGTYWSFRSTYFTPTRWGGWQPKPGVESRISREVRRLAVCMDRESWGMDNRRKFEPLNVTLPEKAEDAYNEIKKTFALGNTSTKYYVTQFTWLRRIAGGCAPKPFPQHRRKLRAALRLITGRFKNEQVIVWFEFRREGAAICRALEHDTVPFCCVHGDVSPRDRSSAVRDFVKGKARVIVCQSSCAQYGWNLSCSSVAIYFSLPVNPNTWAQSLDRITYPGKRSTNLVIPILADGTVDDRIYKLLSLKRKRGRSLLFRAIDELKRGAA